MKFIITTLSFIFIPFFIFAQRSDINYQLEKLYKEGEILKAYELLNSVLLDTIVYYTQDDLFDVSYYHKETDDYFKSNKLAALICLEKQDYNRAENYTKTMLLSKPAYKDFYFSEETPLEFKHLINQFDVYPKLSFADLGIELFMNNLQLNSADKNEYTWPELGDASFSMGIKFNLLLVRYNFNKRFSLSTGFSTIALQLSNYPIIKNKSDTINFGFVGIIAPNIFLRYERPHSAIFRPYIELGFIKDYIWTGTKKSDDFVSFSRNQLSFRVGLNPINKSNMYVFLYHNREIGYSYLDFNEDDFHLKLKQNSVGFGFTWSIIRKYKVEKKRKYR